MTFDEGIRGWIFLYLEQQSFLTQSEVVLIY